MNQGGTGVRSEITTDIGAMVNLVKEEAISRVPYMAEYVKSMKNAIR